MSAAIAAMANTPGFEVPLHRSLTEPILLGGAPRTVAIANGTLASAVGLGLQLWLPGIALWIIGHSLAVWGARLDRSSCRCSRGTSSTACCWTYEAIHGEHSMMHLAEYRKRPALLADWLPWAGLVALGVVLNKDGSFQRTARFRGPDLDSATQGELVATSARLNNALRRLGSGWALFVEAERREAADYPESAFPEPLSWLVDEERRAVFEETDSHFESTYHLTLLYLPPEESQARAAKLLYENVKVEGVDGANWRGRLEGFVSETERFFGLLEGVMPEIVWLDDGQTLTYLHGCVSTRRHLVVVPEVPMHLDALLADEPLTGGLAHAGESALVCYRYAVFPTSAWPGLLDDLNRLGLPTAEHALYLPGQGRKPA